MGRSKELITETGNIQQQLKDEQMTTYYLKPLLTEMEHQTPEQIVQPILDGEKDPISGLTEIHHLLKMLEECKKLVQDLAVEEAEKYGKNEPLPSYLGYRIQKKSGRRSFKFTDPIILSMEQRLKYVKECAKKGIPTEDGEVFDKPQETYTKDYLAFTKQ